MDLIEVIERGKKRLNVTSDRGYAIAANINPQVIVDVKAGKSLPNAFNYLSMIKAAGLTVEEGIEVLEQRKQAGFASIHTLSAIAGLSFIGVTYSPAIIKAVGSMAPGLFILC